MKTSTVSRGLAGYLADARARVDAVLAHWGEHSGGLWPETVAAAMRYSLLGAGKRLRPTLVLAAYEAVGGTAPAIAELAAAIEVVHAYSLVHDDLPCMDDDDLRRGRATTHRAFDVATATRAGFHMVALAAAVLARGMEALALDADRRGAVALELFRAAGAGGMIGGQALDLAAEGQALPVEGLEEVHRRKTGALIAASCAIGGLAAGAVFVCPGATALRPGPAGLVFPGATVFLAGTAGWRSETDGCRGFSNLESGGGPWEGRRTCVSGIPATGIKPSPPSTIANSQPRNTKKMRRPTRRIHRARIPVGSSRTPDLLPPIVVPGIRVMRYLSPASSCATRTSSRDPMSTSR